MTDAWRVAADGLLRIDQVPFDEAKKVIDGTFVSGGWWNGRCGSMAKFRKHYDTMKAQLNRREGVTDWDEVLRKLKERQVNKDVKHYV